MLMPSQKMVLMKIAVFEKHFFLLCLKQKYDGIETVRHHIYSQCLPITDLWPDPKKAKHFLIVDRDLVGLRLLCHV